jgi:hypothetical protein
VIIIGLVDELTKFKDIEQKKKAREREVEIRLNLEANLKPDIPANLTEKQQQIAKDMILDVDNLDYLRATRKKNKKSTKPKRKTTKKCKCKK